MERVLMHDTQRLVAPRAAWLVATAGTLWVTRSGDLDDHVLARGESLAVARGDDLVLQSWRRDQPAMWDWQTRPATRSAAPRDLRAWVWGGVARSMLGVAAAAAALARSAAARACRAQGCVAPGDTMAAAGMGR